MKSKIPAYYMSPEWISLRTAVLKRDKYVCQYCGKRAMQADHVFPRYAGGADDMKNLVASCASCNKALGGTIFKDFNQKKAYIVARSKKISKNKKRKTQLSRIKKIWLDWRS